jgi:HEAT repeat protein
MIIRETSRGESLDQKMIALEYISEAINRGNRNDEIRAALEDLALGGTMTQIRENGRLINNYPMVRRLAARYLGLLGTEEAKNALLRMVTYENEPMVLQEAVKSLGDIGLDNNAEVNTIILSVRRFDTLNPDNILAIATIDAFERIAGKKSGLVSAELIQLLIRFSEGPYISPVQERARQALSNLRGF